ncbi:SDR family NAD(P)-dependent oxidoreductase [Xylanibacillus composti]|uniref:Oxidoreductase n=1 Tax=Xylanibacillus composti TaxID=1572762 RepID=A0A8J4H4N7_9BACL|nr:SDR family oxidoreductase [Xylanibacillus composti]MDT9723485.1 SDR family NAD(P)-dependent oxidoreductase [Xylanibacillus composti]GIQ68478.1 oxidoreductase [Xylanibacillus composti]
MLRDKVVLVTGASSGIGAELGRQLADVGAIPVLVARSEDKLEAVAKSMPSGSRVLTLTADVASTEEVQRAVEQTMARFGKIDALVNNAGFGLFQRVEEMPLADYERMMDVNYMGVVRFTKAVLPHMRQQGEGRIVTVASIAGKLGTAKSAGYSASKHAVIGFMSSLRQELEQETRIRVSVVNPGPVRTAFFDRTDPDNNYLNKVPSWYVLTAEQVARSIVNLLYKPRAEVNLPAIGGLGVKLTQLFPGISSALVRKMTDKK